MRDPAQLGVELGQLEQRMLLHDFSFHDCSLDVPRVGADVADTRTGSDVTEVVAQQAGGLRAPRVLTGPVCDVDQCDVGAPPVLVGGVVPQVGRHVGLHARARDDVEQRVARAAAHRDPRHLGSASPDARTPHAVAGSAAARGRRTRQRLRRRQ